MRVGTDMSSTTRPKREQASRRHLPPHPPAGSRTAQALQVRVASEITAPSRRPVRAPAALRLRGSYRLSGRPAVFVLAR